MDIDPNFTYKKSIITLSVVIIGILGNIISFIVFSRKTFRKSSVSIYCRALAIFEILFVLDAILDVYYILYEKFLYNSSDCVCRLMAYVYYALSSIPGWILVAFSLDRSLNLNKVTNVMKQRPIVTYMILLAIVLFNFLLYVEVPIFIKRLPLEINGTMFFVCDPSTLSFGKSLNVVYIIEGSVLPFLIMLISSIYTIKMLRDSRKLVEMVGLVIGRRKSRDRKFAITSITFNVLFIGLKTPLVICVALSYISVNYYFYQTSLSLFFLNFSISFFVHFFSNSLFRREFFILFGIRKPVVDSKSKLNQTNGFYSVTNTIQRVRSVASLKSFNLIK